MEKQKSQIITVQAAVHAPISSVWELWTLPEHIRGWNFASDDWHAPKSINDPITGGRFVYTMAAKDGSMSFDFSGTYTRVIPHQLMEYTMDDGRKAKVSFVNENGNTLIVEDFEAESENSIEMQKAGWQAILNNFKSYAESL